MKFIIGNNIMIPSKFIKFIIPILLINMGCNEDPLPFVAMALNNTGTDVTIVMCPGKYGNHITANSNEQYVMYVDAKTSKSCEIENTSIFFKKGNALQIYVFATEPYLANSVETLLNDPIYQLAHTSLTKKEFEQWSGNFEITESDNQFSIKY